MKLTKQRLREIIKEEIQKISEIERVEFNIADPDAESDDNKGKPWLFRLKSKPDAGHHKAIGETSSDSSNSWAIARANAKKHFKATDDQIETFWPSTQEWR